MPEAWRQREDGRWVPLEPMPDPFGLIWERCWRFRRERGERKWTAFVRSFFDARAIQNPPAAQPDQETGQ